MATRSMCLQLKRNDGYGITRKMDRQLTPNPAGLDLLENEAVMDIG